MTLAVIEALGIKKQSITLSGYDWSTSIALFMAAKYPKSFDRVIAFHPSLGNTKDN